MSTRVSFVITKLAVLLAILVVTLAFTRDVLQAQSITGIVKNVSGEPVAGALIKVSSAESGLTFMVVSRTQGRYTTPSLPPGKYTVQGFGGEMQSNPGEPMQVSSGQQAKADLVLRIPRKIIPHEKRTTNAEYLKLMPEGDGKRLILTRCVLCHGIERIVPIRAAREDWQKNVNRMRFFLEQNHVPVPGQEQDTIVEYVAKNFGPDTPPVAEKGSGTNPDGHLPRTLLTGQQARFVAMEFRLPRGIWIHDIAVDSQGNAWFTERVSEMIGRFDAKSLTYTRIAPPPAKSPSGLTALSIDPQDNVWFTDNSVNGLLYRYNPTTREFTKYDIPPTDPILTRNINMLRFHPEGSVWGTGITSHRILRLDPSTGKWTEYAVQMGSLPYGLVLAKDNSVWVSTHYGNAVERLNPQSGKLTQYKMTTRNANLRRMQADAEGNLWVTGNETGTVIKVDPRTGKISSFTPPTQDSGPFCIDVDTKRNLIWFGEMYADKLGRYDPRSNTFTEFPLPSADPSVEFSDVKVIWIEVDRNRPNRVWWAGGKHARVGYIEVIE